MHVVFALLSKQVLGCTSKREDISALNKFTLAIVILTVD